MKLKTKEQLPFKYFAVKNDNSLDFKEYITWLNREYNVNFYGDSTLAYYGHDGNTKYLRKNGCYGSEDITTFKNNPKVFTAKEFMKILKKDEILYLEPRLVAKFTKNSELETYLEIAKLNNLTASYTFYDIHDKYLGIDKNNLVFSLVCSPYKDEYNFISDTEFVLRLQNTIDKLNKEKINNKKIIGYKAPYDLYEGKVTKGDILKPRTETIEFYNCTAWRTAIIKVDQTWHIPYEIVSSWEPVYEEIASVQEQKISMGEFNLLIKPTGIFHNNDNITNFVEELYRTYGVATTRFFGSYAAVVKDITFSRTGCESSETKLTDWIKVWNIYQKLKK
jgi:hypothetical protein